MYAYKIFGIAGELVEFLNLNKISQEQIIKIEYQSTYDSWILIYLVN